MNNQLKNNNKEYYTFAEIVSALREDYIASQKKIR